jgi:Type IIA topoisomerase (DNA gyrase/topo II, topoisomerase IV), A subunit
MTREELEREAVRKSLSYNTKYSEDGDLNDMLSRPQDFIEGSIAGMVDLLRKKAYRDGMVDGAEPREKRIADLEKENAQWKQRNETLKDALEHARKVYGDDLEKSYKEIAELKRDKEDLIFIRNQNAKCMCEDKENLTKAKEIIKKLLYALKNEDSDYTFALENTHPVLAEAEQFLKDSEV